MLAWIMNMGFAGGEGSTRRMYWGFSKASISRYYVLVALVGWTVLAATAAKAAR